MATTLMRKLILLAGFICSGSLAFGQNRKATVGLETGPKATITEYNETGMGFGVGGYADLPVFRKLSLATGLRFAELNYSRGLMCSLYAGSNEVCPFQIDRFYALELPIGLNIDLSVRPDVNWKVMLKGGYVLGRTIATESILVRENERTKRGLGLYNNARNYTHGAEFAVEVQGFSTRKYVFAFGPTLRFTQLLQQSEQNNATIVGFNFKVGRNFNVQ
jgi:hypothetical protein